MSALEKAELRDACIRFLWADGFEAEFAAAWLWDNAATTETAVGRQRLRAAQSLIAAGPIRDLAIAGDIVHIAFADGDVAWSGVQLREAAARKPDDGASIVLWSHGDDIAARPVATHSDYLSNDAALAAALSEVARFGLVRLAGAGAELNEIERTVARFGFIRETNYGRLFEVRVVADPDNLAFTAQALEPHTDNPYREPAPTLQLLHCLRNSGTGGATTFIDGFALAEWFRDRHPDHFFRLAQHAVPFAFTNSAGDCYAARTPIIRLSANGDIQGLRFNHRALGSVDFSADETALWYRSYLEFAKEADASARRFPFAMKPGDVIIFDNERILHGREAFSSASDRLLRGCYADRDALKATLARLSHRR